MSHPLFDPSRFSYGPGLIGVAFWIFVAIVVLASIWLAFARNREMQKTIRLAIEKSVQLDAALIDKLVKRRSGIPEDYYVGGIVCIAVGIGLPILGYFFGRIEAEPELQFVCGILVGAGILVGLIGISLIVCGILIGRREKAGKTGNHQT
jgi:hypothetical protein